MEDSNFEPPLASLSLTHVYYNPDDPASLLCAWLALVPQALMVSYATLSVAQRELEVLLMLSGQLACEALNWVLKRCFKQQRPKQMYGKGYGMPSSHAQFVAFFALYLSLWLHLRASHHLPRYQKVLLSILCVAGSAAVSGSRVYLSYHTPTQVACGYSVGVVFAVGWFLVTAWLRETRMGEEGSWGLERLTGGRRLWEWILWVGQWACVKDLCTQVDVVRWEWEVWNKCRVGGGVVVDEGVKMLNQELKKKRS
ncbi:uncharacterized protein H6S33_009494 [Morchella sextelata]|uniref:uncharacterized protein n=1 Tax=Morchella sextelata TaxID=1174677 RepID=UPI001D052681|nr:uncharacterized protein H6S33_009494 [Morchella sextelata]KAH0613114.1 hypothetical protein H6S33_009494 [Morchella sextelata]